MTNPSLSILNNLTVERPCNQAWNTMHGGCKVGFCDSCQESVYDLSKMTRKQANILIREQGESCCIRITRDDNGSVIYDDRNLLQRTILSRLTPLFHLLSGFILTTLPGATVAEAPPSRVLPEAEHEITLQHPEACPPVGTRVNVVWSQSEGWFSRQTVIARALTLLSCTSHKQASLKVSSKDAAKIERALDQHRTGVRIVQNDVPVDPPHRHVVMGKMAPIEKLSKQ